MIHVNLLPAEIQDAERRKLWAVLAGVIGGILVVGLTWNRFHQVSVLEGLQGDLVTAKAELKNLKEIDKKVQKLKATRTLLQERLKIIDQLSQEKLLYPVFIEDFLSILPSDVWISNLNTKIVKSGGISVRMSCTSASNIGVADFVQFLEGSPYFTDSVLSTINVSSVKELGTKKFSFSMEFKYKRDLKDFYG